MKTATYLRNKKYMSFALTAILLFAYAVCMRFYINQNIYKAFNLGNLGEIGQKLFVSTIMAVVSAIGFGLGFLLSFLTKKKASAQRTNILYSLSSVFTVIMLLFTPYNIQLLMPDQILQNIAMINCIALIFFSFVDICLLSWTLNSQICLWSKNLVADVFSKSDISVCSCIAVLSLALAVIVLALKGSVETLFAVIASLLLILNIADGIAPRPSFQEDGQKPLAYFRKTSVVCYAVLAATFIVSIIIGYYITESLIAIPNV